MYNEAPDLTACLTVDCELPGRCRVPRPPSGPRDLALTASLAPWCPAGSAGGGGGTVKYDSVTLTEPARCGPPGTATRGVADTVTFLTVTSPTAGSRVGAPRTTGCAACAE
jgi:hypothetical protein